MQNKKFLSLKNLVLIKKPLFIVIFLAVGLTITITFDNSIMNSKMDSNTIALQTTPNFAVNTLTTHAAISIYTNSGFGSCGCTTGNGSRSNPYIIQNYYINNASSFGIAVEFTTDYFVIQNVVINGTQGVTTSFATTTGTALLINNAQNGVINNVTAQNNYNIGLYLNGSSFITVENSNFLSNGWAGIGQQYSNNNTLTNNTANSNVDYNIYLYHSNYNTLIGNTASVTTTTSPTAYGIGIYLQYSSYNYLLDNTANSNFHSGFNLDYSNSTFLLNNTAHLNPAGILLANTNYNALVNNTASSNGQYDMYLSTSNELVFLNNTATSVVVSATSLDYGSSWLTSISNTSTYEIFVNSSLVKTGLWISGSNIPFDSSTLSPGTYNITFVLKDVLGTLSTQSAIITVPLPPLDTVISQTVLQHGITWIATSPNASTYQILQNGTVVKSGSWSSGMSLAFSTSSLSPGTYNITADFIDSYGRADSQSVILTITSPQAPVTSTITQTSIQLSTKTVTASTSSSSSGTSSSPGETALTTLLALSILSITSVIYVRRKRS